MTDETRESIAFVGDSLIASGSWQDWFSDYEVFAFGRHGETSDELLQRLAQITSARPDNIVLLTGTNDLDRRNSVEHIVRNIESAMVALRRELPESRLLLVSILPREAEFAERIRDANRHLWQFAATVHAQYLDLWPALAVDDTELNAAYTSDGLHLNADGYQAWLSELRPAIQRLREEPPMSGVITLPRVE